MRQELRSLGTDQKKRGYVGKEKSSIDILLAKNSSVIDLEMSFPAIKPARASPRVDVVALERVGNTAKIVFVEVKAIVDSRLTSKGWRARQAGKTQLPIPTPEVVSQIEAYRDYLANDERAMAVATAYRHTCQLLIKLHALARNHRNDLSPLPSLIGEIADENLDLTVGDETRLAVLEGGDCGSRTGAWEDHHEMLNEALKGKGCRPQVLQHPYDLELAL